MIIYYPEINRALLSVSFSLNQKKHGSYFQWERVIEGFSYIKAILL